MEKDSNPDSLGSFWVELNLAAWLDNSITRGLRIFEHSRNKELLQSRAENKCGIFMISSNQIVGGGAVT